MIRCPPTGVVRFIDNETIVFLTYANPDGAHPGPTFFTVKADGTRLRAVPSFIAIPGSRVDPTFEIVGGGTNLLSVQLPGPPARLERLHALSSRGGGPGSTAPRW